MALGFFSHRGAVGQADYLQPIKEMLERTWDLSRVFPVPADPAQADGIGVFNLFFRKLNGIVASILKRVVALSAMAPGLFRFSTEFRNRCLEQEKMIGNISRAGVSMATSVGKIAGNTETLAADSESMAEQVREALALDPGIRTMARATQETALAGYLEQYGFIELGYITDGRGRQVTRNVYAGTTIRPGGAEEGYGRDWSAKEWFREPARNGGTFISKVYRSSATDRFCFTVSVPLVDTNGALSGVLAIDINFEDILTVKAKAS